MRDELLAILGDDLDALWLHGGTTFPDRPSVPGDLDLFAVVARATPDERQPAVWGAQPDSRPSRILAAVETITRDGGIELDLTCILAADAGRGDLPALAFVEAHRLSGWAVVRAHLRTGQYVLLHGRRPEEIVVAPTEGELLHDLDRELEHLERHVYEGDADNPYEATYAIWNGCRILHTIETGNAVVSKRSAGAWGLDHLPDRWHEAIRAAGRSYDGDASADDNNVLRDAMAPFVEMVRERVPVTESRPPGPPRWS